GQCRTRWVSSGGHKICRHRSARWSSATRARARRDRDMTFAAIGAAQAEMADSTAAADYIAAGCLVDAPLGSVGLEVEGHCHDPADPHRRPSWDEIATVLNFLPDL